MAYYALWLDHKQAVIYTFTETGIEEKKIKAEIHQPMTDQDNQKFYHSLAGNFNDAKELMIMGPGVAKDEFKHHCEKHHHGNVSKSIVGVKTMESHPTKARILEEANTFFKHLHMWTKNY